MSKYLIMCEGSNELEIIRILLNSDLLTISSNDLIGLNPYHARQISGNAQVRTELNIYPGNDVVVIRIGDVQNEPLIIPKEYECKITEIKKYCTKPELEMLLIISEGMIDAFEKTKSTITPKEFSKKHISYGRKKYNNSTEFYRLYYGERPQMLVDAIREYKRLRKSHKRDELYLADLLKK